MTKAQYHAQFLRQLINELDKHAFTLEPSSEGATLVLCVVKSLKNLADEIGKGPLAHAPGGALTQVSSANSGGKVPVSPKAPRGSPGTFAQA
jgi:hypothetical protein